MRIRLLTAVLPAVLASSLGWQSARADIYTWVDAAGTVNVSNLSPPEGARVTSVTREKPRMPPTPEDVAREAARQAELQALADRVRQLEDEVQVAQRPAPPPQVVYVPIPAPAPPPVQYQVELTPPATGGCDPSWAGCSGWWGAAYYPASVVVVRAPGFHRFPAPHAGRGFPGHRPVRAAPGFRGRWTTPPGP
jgi:Domain of unknown function (DUF4124)